MRVEHFGRDAAIESRKARQRLFVEPVVRVDEVHVAAGAHDPAEPRLPPEHRAHRVVLEVVDQRDPWRELRLADETVETGRERALWQVDVVELGRRVDDVARADAQREIEDEALLGAGKKATAFYRRTERDDAAVGGLCAERDR